LHLSFIIKSRYIIYKMGNTECCSSSNNVDGRDIKKDGKKHGKNKSIKNL
jgi:hypothetical protein